MGNPITVLIADDHAVVRAGLRGMLEREGMEVVGEATTGREVLQLTQGLIPQVVLLDIRMPDMDGLQTLVALKSACPETSVIILTSYANPGYLARAVLNGAAGFLSKEVEPDHILSAVRAAATGEHLLDPVLLRKTLALVAEETLMEEDSELPVVELSDAENRVLTLLAGGLDNKTIAEALHLSTNTVKTHVSKILKKLNVSDRTQAALWAVRHGFE